MRKIIILIAGVMIPAIMTAQEMTWTQTTDPAWSARYTRSAVAFDNKLWVVGGLGGGIQSARDGRFSPDCDVPESGSRRGIGDPASMTARSLRAEQRGEQFMAMQEQLRAERHLTGAVQLWASQYLPLLNFSFRD